MGKLIDMFDRRDVIQRGVVAFPLDYVFPSTVMYATNGLRAVLEEDIALVIPEEDLKGIWIWEGTIEEVEEPDWPQSTYKFKGTWRRPNASEWECLHKNTDPFE